MQPGYPADFELMFGDFGSNVTEIDAVYERPDDGRIVIFSGSQGWMVGIKEILSNVTILVK